MCYTNGPRCPKHAKQILRTALASRDKDAIQEARKEYYTTTEGIQKLRSQGREDKANQFAQRRKNKIVESKIISAANKAEKADAKRNSGGFLKSRKSKVLVIAGTGFLAASLLSGCSTNSDADYAKVCHDSKSQQRVSDDKCSNDGASSGIYGWYFLSMMNNKSATVPAVGAPLSGGATSIPDSATSKAGVKSTGETVSRSGFGKGGATSKSGFGGGGAKSGKGGSFGG